MCSILFSYIWSTSTIRIDVQNRVSHSIGKLDKQRKSSWWTPGVVKYCHFLLVTQPGSVGGAFPHACGRSGFKPPSPDMTDIIISCYRISRNFSEDLILALFARLLCSVILCVANNISRWDKM